MSTLSLLRNFVPDSVFAYHGGAPIRVGDFLRDVRELATRLPDSAYVLNVCIDRYRFCVGFAAALVRGQITLLPPNQTSDMLERLKSGYPGLYRLTDGDDMASVLPTTPFPDLRTLTRTVAPVPEIPAAQTATVMFTSGSTGEPLPHAKTWGALVASGTAEGARLAVSGSRAALLGTVPPQHMYGLESTLMMPLQCGVAIHAGRPFYPADVCDALRTLPRPRILVTAPVHLRTLVVEASTFPALDLIICATAPLTPQLAAQAEAHFGCPLHEIYGCTEAGQVATRRTVETAEWQALPGIRIRQDEKGAWVSGGHVHDQILLNDMIELKDHDRFVLHGRKADLVNIAGKRTSLAHLNYHLNSIEGVRDGVFIVPEESGESVARLMAFVVAPEVPRDAVLEALRARIDPAFMPRPLSFVPALPRNATGKLPHAALQALASEATGSGR